MGRRGVAAVIAVLFGGVVVGCSPDPAPSTPTPSPTPTWSCTEGTQGPCSEDEAARQKKEIADFAAAEKAYRAFKAEEGKWRVKGGIDKPTKIMTDNAGGPYLKRIGAELAGQKQTGIRASEASKIVSIKPSPGVRSIELPDALAISVCVDGSRVEILNSDGDVLDHGRLTIGTAWMRSVGGQWKVWDDEGEVTKSCDG